MDLQSSGADRTVPGERGVSRLSAVKRDRVVHLFFDMGVIIKGVDGALEIAGGALLLLINPTNVQAIVRTLTLHELSEDPHDIVANYLLNSAQHLSGVTQRFAAVYLLWHGMVKVALIAGLLMKRRRAYPAAIIAFLLFLVYQLYRYSHTHSPELLVLSVLDVVVIVLTWLEYKRLRVAHGFSWGGH